MAFKDVYRSLQEIFPQVDCRLLKAVAIEHCKDVDAAVEFILSEVLPFTNTQPEASNNLHDTGNTEHPLYDGPPREQIAPLEHEGAEVDSCLPLESVACKSAFSDDIPKSPHVVLPCMEEVAESSHAKSIECNASLPSELNPVEHEVAGLDSVASHFDSHYFDGVVSDGCLPNIYCENNFDQVRSNAEPEEASAENGNDSKAYGGVNEQDINKFLNEHEEPSKISVKHTEAVSIASTSGEDISSSVSEKPLDSKNENVNMAFGECEEHQSSCLAADSAEHTANGTEMADDNTLLITVASRSGHAVKIDVLEDFMTDAKSYKKNLLSAVESAMDVMREVELLEERAKESKVTASLAGKGTFTKVDELKQMLKRAAEANDMHAGEVYGEKAILATEARELQSRLLCLSDERNKSFSIIEEIHYSLQARIAAAESEIAAAEQEKLEKEELAQKALKEQELIMETVVEESKRLQKEAQENSKLREFLIDRGRTIDTLQGELAVIFEDVLQLKERVDAHLPLTKSPLLTTCSLASSSSSSNHQSLLSDGSVLPTELGGNPRSTEDDHHQGQQQESVFTTSSEGTLGSQNRKLSEYDDWEFFDYAKA